MKRISEQVFGILFLFLSILLSGFGQNSGLRITTTSSGEYQKNPKTSIYPAFVDNIIYQSWTEAGPSPFFQLTAEGGTPPYTWALTGGALPNGLKLNKNGKIQGMPSKEGNYQFTAKVTDSKGSSVSKPLNFEAAPYRSKWFSDAKFGIYITWGAYSAPSLKGKDGIAQFEKRITKFNADEWAQTVVDLGGKVLTANVKAGDGVRLWPSTTPSKLELKTKRNIVKELVEACHKKNIRFIAYIAPDNGWNKDVIDTSPDGTYGTLNLGLIRELIAMGVDGFWVDMTSATELYQGFDYNWFPWSKMIPIMRTNNPKVIFANNTGLGFGGTVLQYPNTDVIVYEGGTSPHETALEVAKPATVRKKLAIEVDNLLDNSWSWREDPKQRSPKPVDMMINNIKKNWEAGATYMLSYPVTADGEIMPDLYKDRLLQIAAFVRKNQGWSRTPQASLSDTVDYRGAQKLSLTASARSKIYYTIDGSRPTTTSKLYKSPILISKTCRVQAVAWEPGMPVSKVFDKTFTVLDGTKLAAAKANPAPPAAHSAARSAAVEVATVGKTEPKGFYRGMRITVGSVPIRVTEVGRKQVAGNSERHTIIIKRFVDDYPLLTASLNTAVLPVGSDGYQYAAIPPITLEAGKSYVIGFREDNVDKYFPDDFKSVAATDDYRVIGYNILSPQGAKFPVVDDKIGQLVGLKYEKVGADAANTNLALGKHASLRANNDQGLGPANQIYFAENGIDGDPNTRAQAGGQYPWTFLVDLIKVEKGIKEAKITFGKTAFSTEFVLMASPDNKNWTTLAQKSDNSDLNIDLKFNPIDARYFKLRSLKPEKSGDRGGSMGVLEFELYR
ncbi:Putative Ig domain-containing protein [Dyadobacter sp. SG02]|uniref:alpha-L-fucosidase n=1 Tax=Dyadobacter sp. SG02 TaxID=1855291 RepID=UPI0008D47F03|nr:alpha-L-fucosidase [Dyadobacter sp. SG02]SEJ32773.1 Putative Ig domain-containing protein [Dyadobacter sp. SG02]